MRMVGIQYKTYYEADSGYRAEVVYVLEDGRSVEKCITADSESELEKRINAVGNTVLETDKQFDSPITARGAL